MNFYLKKKINVFGNKISYLKRKGLSINHNIIFLHGFGLKSFAYRKSLDALDKKWNIIAPVLPLKIKNCDITINVNYFIYAYFINVFMKKIGLEKAHFIGHSMGGGIVSSIAAYYPKNILSII